MMKQITFNIILFLLSRVVISQAYQPFCINSNIWYYSGIGERAFTEIFLFKGDTMVNGMGYKLFGYQDAINILSLIREDTIEQKVYHINYSNFINHGDIAENLLYDFSLVPGDSIYTFGWFFVDSIGSIDSLFGNRKILYLSSWEFSPGFHYYDIWIEGIGSYFFSQTLPVYYETELQYHSIFPVLELKPIKYSFLNCFQSNNKNIYSSNLAKEYDCYLDISLELEAIIPNNFNIKIYTAQNQILISSPEFVINKIELYNILGRKIYESTYYEHEVVFYHYNLSLGYYIIRITCGNRTTSKQIIINDS